jgi:hypothetical protein
VIIEWATICAEVDTTHEPQVNLIGANAGGITIDRELPADVPLTIAICLYALPEELRAGGIVEIVCTVYNPAGAPIRGERLVWIYEEGAQRPYAQLPGRHIVPVSFRFDAEIEGLHTVGIGIQGIQRFNLPYDVRYLPATD